MLKSRISILLIGITISLAHTTFAQVYANSLDAIPADWGAKPKFMLRHDYPTELSKIKDVYAWKGIDFKTKPEQYLNAVLNYFYKGNTEVDFVIQKNETRQWYHAPGLAWQPKERPWGREFIRGLTRELTSPLGHLHPNQTSKAQNWAVGFYNAVGAYSIGKAWRDTTHFPKKITFDANAVSAKLLFTTATDSQVPYLAGSKKWDANINGKVGEAARSVQSVRLIQVDLAVKDPASPTGWVFGTFIYDKDSPATNEWEKLFCVGLAWGQDTTQQWIHPGYKTKFPYLKLGTGGGLNGPVDNPKSSCMKCHAIAGEKNEWDYSLQLERGIVGFKNNKGIAFTHLGNAENFSAKLMNTKGNFPASFFETESLTTEEMTIDELREAVANETKTDDDNALISWTVVILVSSILLFVSFLTFNYE